MIHKFKTKVYYADTDAYGVVWHGSYIRLFEQARTEYCKDFLKDLKYYEQEGIVLPVVNLDVKYKKSAMLHDDLIIETKISKSRGFSITFNQIVKRNDEELVIANVEVVALQNGKLCRKIPLDGIEKLIETAP